MLAQCIDLQTLRDYLAGKAEPRRGDEIEAHLQSCSACLALATQPEGQDSLAEVICRTAKGKDQPADRHLAQALERVVGMDLAATLASDSDRQESTKVMLIRDYELQRKLGEGGMGTVYLATHTRLKKQVAVKLLKADRLGDSSAVSRFAAEMEAVGKLEHPHIVRALDAGEENGIHFLVMEYLPGIDLNRVVRGVGQLTVADACEVVRQAALGLQHAHENDVIHRDVKPSNIMLLPTGKVKVLDLGLARFRPSLPGLHKLTQDHQVVGTMLYIAPEQLIAGGKIEAKCDIFSLGIALYELLLGRLPTRQGVIVKVTAEEQDTQPKVPPDIWKLAAEMTSLDPTERPASMAVVAETLRPWTVGANLPALLQKVAGYTSMVGQPPFVMPSAIGDTNTQLVAAGIPIQSLSGSGSGSPPATVSPEISRDFSQSFNRVLLATAGGLLAMTVVLLLLIAIVVNGNKPEPAPPIPDLPPKGIVTINQGDPTYRKVLEFLFAEGKVYARDAHGHEFPLKLGENELPPGDYTLQHSGADYNVLPQSFRIAETSKIAISPEVDHPFPWLYPQLPRRSGEFAKYRGTLWHIGLGTPQSAKELTFDLTLTAGDETDVGGVKHRWVKFVVQDQRHSITETAWLELDEGEWQTSQRLEINSGYLQAESSEIGEASKRTFGENGPQALVTKFDPREDTLAAQGAKHSVNLPPRVNIHQVLVLLFGATLEGAPPIIRQVRANLPTQREFELGNVLNTQGSRHGLRMRARSPQEGEQPSTTNVYLARSESIPFSFTTLEVNSPVFVSGMRLESFSRQSDELSPVKIPKKELEVAIDKWEVLPPPKNPFDYVTLPTSNNVGAKYTGALTTSVGKTLYTAEIRMRGNEVVDKVPHRWLEVTVRSGSAGLDHSESAILLIDEQEYAAGNFIVRRGWLECQDETFEFEPTGDLREVERKLHFLGKSLPPERFRIHDVISLLFGGSLNAARFNHVRAMIADELLQNNRKRTHEFGTVELRDTRRTVRAEISELSKLSGKPTSSYRIVRSDEVPFDFVEVIANLSNGVILTAELQKTLESSGVAVRTLETFVIEAEKTDKLVSKREAELPNWNLWRIKRRPLPVWAEYGGRVDGTMLLRTELDEIIKIPLEDLLEEKDRSYIMKRGRVWFSRDDSQLFRGELIGAEKVKLRFDLYSTIAVPNQPYFASAFSPVDRRLIEELRKLLPSPTPSPPPATLKKKR